MIKRGLVFGLLVVGILGFVFYLVTKVTLPDHHYDDFSEGMPNMDAFFLTYSAYEICYRQVQVDGDSVIFIEHQSQSTGYDQADENETTYYEVDLADVRAIYEKVLDEESDHGAAFEEIMKDLAGVYHEVVEEPGDFNLPHLSLE